VCFHIEHAIGSGYTPENPAPMFERLEQRGIGWLDFNVIEPLLNEMQDKGAIDLNTERWGLRDIPLDETVCTRERIDVRKVPEALQADRYAPVTAIRPEFNADRHFRMALKRLEARFDDERAQFYDERAQFHGWLVKTKERAEAAEAWLAKTKERAEAAEAWLAKTKKRAEAAEAWLAKTRERAEAAEAQLERLRVKNDQKRRLLDKYRRFFGWLEKLPSFK